MDNEQRAMLIKKLMESGKSGLEEGYNIADDSENKPDLDRVLSGRLDRNIESLLNTGKGYENMVGEKADFEDLDPEMVDKFLERRKFKVLQGM